MRRYPGPIAVAAFALTAAAGCDKVKEELTKAAEVFRTGPRQLSDDDAFQYLRKDRTKAPETDVGAVMDLIEHEVAAAKGGGGAIDDPKHVRLLRKVTQARLTIDERKFDRVDFFRFGAGDDGQPREKAACTWDLDLDRLRDEYVIPDAKKIPVRNQGYRGTCAAFTGIGAVEYAALKVNEALPTLDLSEQRFYFNSKPECQEAPNCRKPFQEGSWYGAGFERSANSADLDIPLETDCPYNNQPGDNDVQYPQPESCRNGAVKLEQVDTWCGMNELVEVLHEGFAVPWASPLSQNWEVNDGLITAKDFTDGGSTVHAGGHAYLIVGYKKLPDMPEEGGVCFVIKNSWGIGWGVNGYSCMTLAWMKAVQFKDGPTEFIHYRHPVVKVVALRDDLAMSDELPPDNEEAEDETPPDIQPPDEDDQGNGTDDIEPPPEPDDEDEEEEPLPPEEPDVDPAPDEEEVPDEEEPAPPADMFQEAGLYGPNESFYKVYVLEKDGELYIQGVLRGDERDRTKALRVQVAGEKLAFNGDVVGQRNGDRLTLCTGEWAALCSLRYRKADGTFYIQFRDDDLRDVKDEEVAPEKGEWIGIEFQGRRYEIFKPKKLDSVDFLANPKTYLRVAGRKPLRLSLSRAGALSQFAMKIQGLQVGQVDFLDPANSALCSGAFADVCRIVGGDRLFVIPQNKRKR